MLKTGLLPARQPARRPCNSVSTGRYCKVKTLDANENGGFTRKGPQPEGLLKDVRPGGVKQPCKDKPRRVSE